MHNTLIMLIYLIISLQKYTNSFKIKNIKTITITNPSFHLFSTDPSGRTSAAISKSKTQTTILDKNNLAPPKVYDLNF